jgi:hypothetical protein
MIADRDTLSHTDSFDAVREMYAVSLLNVRSLLAKYEVDRFGDV